MKNRYRIVTDQYAGFESQIKYWWLPFVWWQIGINTHLSLEQAKAFIQKHRQRKPKAVSKVVWIDDEERQIIRAYNLP